jgi:hypothetical protein
MALSLRPCLTVVLVCWCARRAAFIVVGDSMGEDSIQSLEKAHHLYMACQLCILTGLYAYYGWRLAQVNPVPYFDVTGDSGTGSRPMVLLTALGFAVFLSRTVYGFVTAFGIGLIQLGGDNGGLKTPNAAALFSFMWWEGVPTLAVLIYFRTIPKTRVRACSCLPCCPADDAPVPAGSAVPNSDALPDDPNADPYHEPFAQYGPFCCERARDGSREVPWAWPRPLAVVASSVLTLCLCVWSSSSARCFLARWQTIPKRSTPH